MVNYVIPTEWVTKHVPPDIVAMFHQQMRRMDPNWNDHWPRGKYDEDTLRKSLNVVNFTMHNARKVLSRLHQNAVKHGSIQPAKGEPYGLAGQLEQAFNQIGESMMSDDFAAKLLAWLYVLGGGLEAVTMHKGLNAGIQIAQQKFNFYGGNVPEWRHVELIQKYNAELAHACNDHKTEGWGVNISRYVPWVKEIYDKYNLTILNDNADKRKTKE